LLLKERRHCGLTDTKTGRVILSFVTRQPERDRDNEAFGRVRRSASE